METWPTPITYEDPGPSHAHASLELTAAAPKDGVVIKSLAELRVRLRHIAVGVSMALVKKPAEPRESRTPVSTLPVRAFYAERLSYREPVNEPSLWARLPSALRAYDRACKGPFS